MKNIKILIMTFLICNSFSMECFGDEPIVGAKGAVLMSKETGRVLWGKDEEIPLAMASTTKIMTAILVLERSNLDDYVYVSKNASNQPKVHMNLAEGEVWTVEDMLYAMMLASYNDTAVALAEFVGGTVDNFCSMMTDKARELGAEDTVFGTPNGLDSHLNEREHCSSPKDMAIITAYALNNNKFCEIIETPNITITEVHNKRQVNVNNADSFLNTFEGAIGVKTGYTNRAGHCFVGGATREDNTLISVVLASGWGDHGKVGKWTDTQKIMEYGFENFSMEEVVFENNFIGEVEILESPTKSINCVTEEGFIEMLSKEELENLELNINYINTLTAPVLKGEKIGTMEVKLYDEILKEINLLSYESAKRFNLFQWLGQLKENWLDWY